MSAWEEVPMFEPPDNRKPWQGGPSPEGRAEGEAARDAALERVEDNAGPDWNDRAFDAIATVARRQVRLTSEDAWPFVGRPRESRAMGPVMLRAKRAGLIAPTGEFVKSSISSRHAGPVRVWISLVYEGE